MPSGLLAAVARIGTVGLHLIGELVAPMQCAACEQRVGPRLLFCGACGISVMPACEQTRAECAVFDYGGAVATAIVRFKYGGRADLAPRLAGVMANAASSFAADVDLVVPVPLHPRRLVERGFDQSALLAAPVARRLGVAHEPRALIRTRVAPAQASLDRAARAVNVREAFACPDARRVEGRRVLLVDDVRTTGATLASCAEALRTARAADVRTLVLASRERAANVQKDGDDEDSTDGTEPRYHPLALDEQRSLEVGRS